MVQGKSQEGPSSVGPGVLDDRVRPASGLGASSGPSPAGDAARRWFREPLSAFGGMTPAALIEEGRAGEVARYLKAWGSCLVE